MEDLVSEALFGRVREPEGLQRMLSLSLVAHLVVGVAVLLMPSGWRQSVDDDDRMVMTISLGGTPGPKTGGMTPIAGTPVQQVEPENAKPKPFTPPSVKPAAMSVPLERATRRPPPPPVEHAPEEARGRRPTTGPEVREGNAMAETPGQENSIGISTGGGGYGGQLELGDFCCPEYIQTMIQIIDRNWSSRRPMTAVTTMRFMIARDGTLSDIGVQKSSGYPDLDMIAQRALLATRLPPLPGEYPHPDLEVELYFHYHP
ncbi:MAG: hypothetical protein GEU99_09675 [Luteitalea sp.]|nr:hypothetical protein [Luteitalea sp.]